MTEFFFEILALLSCEQGNPERCRAGKFILFWIFPLWISSFGKSVEIAVGAKAPDLLFGKASLSVSAAWRLRSPWLAKGRDTTIIRSRDRKSSVGVFSDYGFPDTNLCVRPYKLTWSYGLDLKRGTVKKKSGNFKNICVIIYPIYIHTLARGCCRLS